MNTKLLLAALFALPLTACGGRASIDRDAYRNARRVWNAQINSQPSRPISNLSADDAKAALGKKGSRSSGGRISFGGGRRGSGGQLTPSTTDLSGGGGPGGRQLRLQ
jgi:hypothetical protein